MTTYEQQEESTTTTEEHLTVKEAAIYLGKTPNNIYAMQSNGTLPRVQWSNAIVIPRSALDAYRAKLRGEVSTPTQAPPETKEPEPEGVPIPAEEHEEMPLCHRCGRRFDTEQDYRIEKFIHDGKPYWYPVCRDGRCDPVQQNWQGKYEELTMRYQAEVAKSASLLVALKTIYQQIGETIARYEEEKTQE